VAGGCFFFHLFVVAAFVFLLLLCAACFCLLQAVCAGVIVMLPVYGLMGTSSTNLCLLIKFWMLKKSVNKLRILHINIFIVTN
jgi:hypothetical protein